MGSQRSTNWAAGPTTRERRSDGTRRRKGWTPGNRRNRQDPEDQLGIFEPAQLGSPRDANVPGTPGPPVQWREPTGAGRSSAEHWRTGAPVPSPPAPPPPAGFPVASAPPRPDVPSGAAWRAGVGPTPEEVARSRAEFRNPGKSAAAAGANRKRAKLQIGVGVALAAGGAIATAAAHAAAVNAGGGTYVIWTGPMIAGVINVVRGAARYRGS